MPPPHPHCSQIAGEVGLRHAAKTGVEGRTANTNREGPSNSRSSSRVVDGQPSTNWRLPSIQRPEEPLGHWVPLGVDLDRDDLY